MCQWHMFSTDRSDCVHEQVAKRIVNVRFTKNKKVPESDIDFLELF